MRKPSHLVQFLAASIFLCHLLYRSLPLKGSQSAQYSFGLPGLASGLASTTPHLRQ